MTCRENICFILRGFGCEVNTHVDVKCSVMNLRKCPTTPSALSPKSLSFSLRQTTVGVFLLDSLKKNTTDIMSNSETWYDTVFIWAGPPVTLHPTSKSSVDCLCVRRRTNTQLHSLVEDDLHRHPRLHYRHFHPLAAQVHRHDGHRHCEHKDMKLLRRKEQHLPSRGTAEVQLIYLKALIDNGCVFTSCMSC